MRMRSVSVSVSVSVRCIIFYYQTDRSALLPLRYGTLAIQLAADR